MNTRTKILGMLAIPSFLLCQGCIIIGVHGWSNHPKVWSESVSEEFSIDSDGVSGLEVRTDNGAIAFAGEGEGAGGIHVTATKRGGGNSDADAHAALEAIEVYSKPSSDGTQRFGWRWRGLRRTRWQARVSFDITGPSVLNIDGETHNGGLHVADVDGDVRIATHNGGVRVEAVRGRLHATTHNGPIAAAYEGGDLVLTSHNGSIDVDLSRCQALNAEVTTHNGGIELVLGNAVSGRLDASTDNGHIRCNVPVAQSRITKRRLTGTVGDGQGNLDISTHNGGIRIEKAAG